MTGALDPVIHPPARLQIMAMLAEVQDAEFAVLRSATGVSDSVLSKHLSALTEAGYVSLRKTASGGRVRTWAAATRGGADGVSRPCRRAEIVGGRGRPDGGRIALPP